MSREYLFADPHVEDYYLALQNARVRQGEHLRNQLAAVGGPRQAIELAARYPTMSKPMLAGFALLGDTVPADSEGIAKVVENADAVEAKSFLDKVWTGLKATGRTAFTVFDTLWEEGPSRLFKTVVGGLGLTDQINFGDFGKAWNLVGASAGMQALGELFEGNKVNLGSGIMPRSNQPEETGSYKRGIAAGLSPEQARQAGIAEVGAPITTLARQQQETQLTRGGRPVSPGRFLADMTWLEEDSVPYHFLSGAVDAAAQIYADPTALALKAVKGARLNRTLLSGADEAAATALRGTAGRRAAGLFRPHRYAVHGRSATSFLNGTVGRRFADVVDAVDETNVALLMDMVRPYRRGFPADFLRRAADGEPARDLFMEMVEKGKMRTAPVAGPVSRALGGVVAGDFGALAGVKAGLRRRVVGDTGWDRLFRQMPGGKLNIEDLDEGLWQLDDFLISAGMDVGQRSPYLMRWMRMDPAGGREEAFKIATDVMGDVTTRIVADWEPAFRAMGKTGEQSLNRLRKQMHDFTDVFRSHDEMRSYFSELSGHAGWHPSAKLRYIDDTGRIVTAPRAHIVSEYLERSIPLPDARMMRRSLSPTRRGVISSPLSVHLKAPSWAFDGPLGAGSLTKYLVDPYMQNFWKPMTLLRVAWPARVIGEEAIRIGAAGLDSIFTHPVSALAWMIHNPDRNAVTRLLSAGGKHQRGRVGVMIEKYPGIDPLRTNLADVALHQGLDYQAALSKRMGKFFTGMWGDTATQNAWRRVTKGERQFTGAWFREMYQLVDEPLAQQVARNLDDAKAWLRTAEGEAYRRRLATSGTDRFADDIMNNPAVWDLQADSVYARLHMKTGGKADLQFDTIGDGTGWARVSPADLPKEFGDAIESGAWGRVRYDFTDPVTFRAGDAHLVNMVASGRFTDSAGKVHDLADLTDISRKHVVSELGRDRWQQIAPQYVKGAVEEIGTGIGGAGEKWKEIIDRMFTVFMSKPTNTLSRSPAFKQFYWQRAEELLPFVDDVTRRQILAAARKANLQRPVLKRIGDKINQLAGRPPAAAAGGVSLEEVDNLAKAFGLDSTKQLLYDTSRRNQITDMVHNMMPFGEAWLEIVSTWSRLLVENPNLWRRGQQIIEGARESNPLDIKSKDGFFSTDPESGEEMFNYPSGLGLAFGSTMAAMSIVGIPDVVNLIGDPAARELMAGSGRAGLKLQGRVAGLNIVSGSVIPGFGPVMQIPASHMLASTRFDAIRGLILPFGEQKLTTLGSVVDNALPSWLKRFTSGLGFASPEQKRILAGTTVDVYRTLVIQGADVSDVEKQNEVMKRATSIANSLTVIRGAAQMGLPTGPEFKFYLVPEADRQKIGDAEADLIEGRVWLYQTLASEYREKLFDQFDGDDVATFDWFQAAFGVDDPTLFATAKSKQVAARSTTIEGDRWGRDNPQLFEVAPYTAYYAHPDDPTGDEFDYNAYLRSVQEGARVGLSPEQWEMERNDLLGRIRYERARREADEMFGPATTENKVRVLQAVRLFLMREHYGYRVPNPGAPETPSVTQMMMELETIWPNHPELAGSGTGRALAEYMEARQLVKNKGVELGLGLDGWKNADRALALREFLCRKAQALIDTPGYADFAHLWQLVLSHEFDDDTEALATLGAGNRLRGTG
ncbi:MAG: hypothetical protein ABIJ75_05900 [Actinomycetota bacterium]